MASLEGQGENTVRAFAYVFREMQGCLGHVADALEAHLNGEEMPASLFSDLGTAGNKGTATKGRKPRKKNGEVKRTRKPTAFNAFVKQKIEELKGEGVSTEANGGKTLFKLAVEGWTKLSDAQRAKFTSDYKADEEVREEGGTPAPPGPTPRAAQAASSGPPTSPAAAAADGDAAATAEKKKKKKKRHREDSERHHEGDTDGERKKKKKKKKDKPEGEEA